MHVRLAAVLLLIAAFAALTASDANAQPQPGAPAPGGQRPQMQKPAPQGQPQPGARTQQPRPQTAPPRTQPQPQAKAQAKIPPAQVVTVPTKDGVDLAVVYYPGLRGKESVPVVLLHGFMGAGKDYQSLAKRLQADGGHAVIVPDLRGHGRSNKRRQGGDLDPERFRMADFAAMVTMDMEALKKFILARNNAGELNVEKLCIVGAELGTIVALNWAALDWNWPVLPTIKQGRDVKALVLLSPEWTFKGLKANDGVAHPAVSNRLSILLVVGAEDSKAMRDAKRMHATFEKGRPSASAEDPAKQDLFFMDSLRTSLQGTALLGERSLRVEDAILQFIEMRLVQQSFPWTDRSR